MNQPSVAGKRILLLQGPVGPFFRNLAKDLRQQGAQVYKFNFNTGDWLFYPKGAVTFRGNLSEWSVVLQKFLETHGIDAILLFGDCRPVHAVVREIAPVVGVEVGVFEEGYLRPDYVTFERSGVNGYSCFTSYFSETASDLGRSCRATENVVLPSKHAVLPVGNAFWHSAAWGMLYFFVSWLGQWYWNNQLRHRRMTVLDSPWWWLSFGRKLWFRWREQGMQQWLTKEKQQQFFLVPLQVYNDAQIVVHSDYASVMQFIARVMRSYASALQVEAHGALEQGAETLAGTILVFKHHPMDRGHRYYGKAIARLSERLGLQGRVFYIHDQHLPSILKAARGVVVVNSTVGWSALMHGAAVKVCGRALYDQPGLTFSGLLDAFWHHARGHVPCKHKVIAFKQAMIDHTQINGNFYRKLRGVGARCGVVLADLLPQRLWGRPKVSLSGQAGAGLQKTQAVAAGVAERCIDPAVSAQVRPLMQMPQREFSCSTPDVDAGGCKSQSRPR